MTEHDVTLVDACATLDAEQARAFLEKRRRSLLQELADIEDFLGMERSVAPKRARQRETYEQYRERLGR